MIRIHLPLNVSRSQLIISLFIAIILIWQQVPWPYTAIFIIAVALLSEIIISILGLEKDSHTEYLQELEAQLTAEQLKSWNLEQLLQQKEEFISVASHELKLPVTSLRSWIQLCERMLKEEQYEELQHYFYKTVKHMDKLGELIADLLEVSRMEVSSEMHVEEITLNELLYDCIEMMQRAFPEHSTTLQINDRIQLKADKQKLQRVFYNLLTNAAKYSPAGSMITIEAHCEEGSILIRVKDEGDGIPADKLPYIFERYYRVSENGQLISGLGLGLYIVSEIIRQHDGRIWVESIPGQGSCFYLQLPMQHT